MKKKIFALALCMVLAMMPSMVPSESMTLTSLSRISSLICSSLLLMVKHLQITLFMNATKSAGRILPLAHQYPISQIALCTY